MKTFKDLVFNERNGTMIHAEVQFPNTYGVSVIKGFGSYGYREGLYELAILYEKDICYTTDIASDVIGRLTPDAISTIMGRVQALAE